MKASIIISVYKNTCDLKVVLDALVYQTEKDFEIIISEDGASAEMQLFLSKYSSNFNLQHLTQADEGWRKNKALNRAIQSARSNYLIFIDGDCVLHHRFIENHLKFAHPKTILAGKRVKLGKKYSNILRKSDLIKFEKRFLLNTIGMFKDGVQFFEEGIYLAPNGPLGFLAKLRTISQLKGCNFSCYKDALIAINGFDEDYEKPAIGEDIDLTWRFKGLDYQIKSLRNLAVQYHLWHKENWTSQEENLLMMQQKKMFKAFVCTNGLLKR